MKVLLQFALEEVGEKSVEKYLSHQIIMQQWSFVDNLDFQ